MKHAASKLHRVRIDGDLQNEAVAKIKAFSIALILDNDLAGSGTLIRWGQRLGILTAHHVPHSPDDPARRFDFKSDQTLFLTVQEDPCAYGLPMRSLRCIDIGIPRTASTGPDLAVLLLPEAGVGTLKAKKDFFHIEHRASEKMQSALRNDGFFLLIGYPEYERREKGAMNGFSDVSFTPAISIFGQPVRRYSREAFDFLEIPVGPHEVDGAIPNFQRHFRWWVMEISHYGQCWDIRAKGTSRRQWHRV